MSKEKSINIGMVAAMLFPPNKASGIRVKNEIYSIKDKINIKLYCAPPGPIEEKHDDFEIRRAKTELNSKGYFEYYRWKNRLRIDIELARAVARDIKTKRIDILHVHTVEGIFISLIAKMLACRRIPVVADIHGPFLPELVHYRMIPDNAVIKLFFNLAEKLLYRSVDRLMATSNGLAGYLKGKAHPNKVILLSDYVVLSDFTASCQPLPFAKKVGNKVVISYAGALKDYQGIDILLDAYKLVLEKNQHLMLVIVGDGGLGKDYYEKMARNLGIYEHCVFVGRVPHEEVPNYLQQSDILVSSRIDNSVTRGGFVSQMPEYLAAGKVIVSTSVSDCDKMLSGGAGIIVKPNSSQDLAKGILVALDKKRDWPRYQQAALKRAKEYSWEENSKRLIGIYGGILSNNERD